MISTETKHWGPSRQFPDQKAAIPINSNSPKLFFMVAGPPTSLKQIPFKSSFEHKNWSKFGSKGKEDLFSASSSEIMRRSSAWIKLDLKMDSLSDLPQPWTLKKLPTGGSVVDRLMTLKSRQLILIRIINNNSQFVTNFYEIKITYFIELILLKKIKK